MPYFIVKKKEVTLNSSSGNSFSFILSITIFKASDGTSYKNKKLLNTEKCNRAPQPKIVYGNR